MLSSLLLPLVALLPSALAGIGTFQISQPLQCGELLINWSHTGSIAATDYNLVLIPTSDQNQVLSNISFTSTTNTYTLEQLPLGKGVEFIALLQDSVDGADGGRVSQVVKVADQDAGGTGCLANLDHTLDGSFAVSTTTPSQCGDFSVTWEAAATGPVGITGLIPGGMSFDVPVTNAAGRQADWPFRVLSGTKVLFAMSTNGQKGSAGSSPLYTVGSGSDSCIRGANPNSEAAVIYSSLPVGDVPTTLTVYATLTVSGQATTIFQTQSAGGGGVSGSGSSSSGSSNGGGGGTNVGAIAGGVVGGVAFLLLLAGLVWFCVRKRDKKRMDEKHAANNDMTAAGRPWSPPLPADPETNPIYAPGAYFGNGGGTNSAHNSMVGLGSPGTTHASSNSLYNSTGGGVGGPGSSAPSAFSHIPPGAMMGSSSGGHGSESEGRTSIEKRGYPAAGSTSGARGGDGELVAPGPLGEDSRRDSVTRFVRHEDAGALPASGEGRSPDEVVDLPPLYQDAGERATATGH